MYDTTSTSTSTSTSISISQHLGKQVSDLLKLLLLLLLLLLLHSKYSGLILRRLGAASRNLAAISRDDCEVVLPRMNLARPQIAGSSRTMIAYDSRLTTSILLTYVTTTYDLRRAALRRRR